MLIVPFVWFRRSLCHLQCVWSIICVRKVGWWESGRMWMGYDPWCIFRKCSKTCTPSSCSLHPL